MKYSEARVQPRLAQQRRVESRPDTGIFSGNIMGFFCAELFRRTYRRGGKIYGPYSSKALTNHQYTDPAPYDRGFRHMFQLPSSL
jgi:hypothetical protein